MKDVELVVVSPLKALPIADRRVRLTRKFLDGMELYKEYWKGPVTLLCEASEGPSTNLDNCDVDLDEAPFRLVLTSLRGTPDCPALPSSAIVLAAVQFTQVSRWARSQGFPCVYVTEYSLRTRLEIVREERSAGPWRVWRNLYERRLETAQRQALALADGVQCNGVPTYRDYRSLTPLPLLFFDTRIEEARLATPGQVQRRWSRWARERKLRLVFSGRLTRMKGVQHLPEVALHLRRLGVPFELSICGDGDLLEGLKTETAEQGLSDCVRFLGTLDFKTKLVPFVAGETDLFVCCHPQGDPSCTYLETMGCGVPVVGFGNEALLGLSEAAGTGWATPVNRPRELAERIARIAADPDGLLKASLRSLEFARDHTFEKTFCRRIDHLNQVLRAHQSRLQPV